MTMCKIASRENSLKRLTHFSTCSLKGSVRLFDVRKNENISNTKSKAGWVESLQIWKKHESSQIPPSSGRCKCIRSLSSAQFRRHVTKRLKYGDEICQATHATTEQGFLVDAYKECYECYSRPILISSMRLATQKSWKHRIWWRKLSCITLKLLFITERQNKPKFEELCRKTLIETQKYWNTTKPNLHTNSNMLHTNTPWGQAREFSSGCWERHFSCSRLPSNCPPTTGLSTCSTIPVSHHKLTIRFFFAQSCVDRLVKILQELNIGTTRKVHLKRFIIGKNFETFYLLRKTAEFSWITFEKALNRQSINRPAALVFGSSDLLSNRGQQLGSRRSECSAIFTTWQRHQWHRVAWLW